MGRVECQVTLDLLEKSEGCPLDEIRREPAVDFTWSRATYLLRGEQVRYRFYWVSNQWRENNRWY